MGGWPRLYVVLNFRVPVTTLGSKGRHPKRQPVYRKLKIAVASSNCGVQSTENSFTGKGPHDWATRPSDYRRIPTIGNPISQE